MPAVAAPLTLAAGRGPGFGGPVRGAAEEHQDGGQKAQGAQYGADDADRADGAERAVVGEVAQQQGEEAEGHRGGARGDGAGGLPQGGAHRGGPVRPERQFFPEAGREQEGVVRGGADDEDREDALHLAVDAYDVPVGERVHDGAGESEGEDGAENDDQREEHAAVDEQQDDQDGEQGDTEQQAVDSGERVGEIGLARGGARELDGGAGYGRRRVVDPREGVGQSVAEAGPELDDSLECFAVLGRQGGDAVPTTPGLPVREARARVAAARWSSPSGVPASPSAVQTTTAGSVSSWSKARCASITWVDSAFRGRKAAWSLVATSPSFPAYGPSVPPMPSQVISRAAGTSHRATRVVVGIPLPGK